MDRDGTGDVSLQNLEESWGSRAHAEGGLGELAGNAEFRRTGKLTLAALEERREGGTEAPAAVHVARGRMSVNFRTLGRVLTQI